MVDRYYIIKECYTCPYACDSDSLDGYDCTCGEYAKKLYDFPNLPNDCPLPILPQSIGSVDVNSE
jgi:hypothetical protein